MDLITNLESGERVLRKERIHPGIFAIPAMALIAELIVALPIAFLISLFNGLMKSLNQSNPPAAVHVLYLIIGTMLLLPAIAVFVTALLAYLKSEITLTNKRLMYSAGFLVRVAGELPLQNIEAMFIQEPIIGRMFGFGTVIVSGIGGLRFPLRFIGGPQVFYATLQRAVSDAKSAPRPGTQPPTPSQDDSRYLPKA